MNDSETGRAVIGLIALALTALFWLLASRQTPDRPKASPSLFATFMTLGAITAGVALAMVVVE